jgi:hypothetical protein
MKFATLLLLLLATLLLFAAPAPAQTIVPDAALVAYSPDGTVLDAASWGLAQASTFARRSRYASAAATSRAGSATWAGIRLSDLQTDHMICNPTAPRC